ncbi:MAG TPA: hypothetical protein DD429_06975 [Clostridiaceae bacterium]|jgi:hypothetical protein|nr:hypothetical protein [Clostridiaceae bacterium]
MPLSEDVRNGYVYIDGFNLMSIIEVALFKSIIALGNDGVIRDLAGLQGTYKLIEQTDNALELIERSFNSYECHL